MADDNLSANSPERTYFLSADFAEDRRRALPLIIYGRQCYMCRLKVKIEQCLMMTSAQFFVDAIIEHCSRELDYLLPDTPMKEAIFRVLLANGNERITADGVSDELSRKWAMTPFPRPMSPLVMRRLLEDMASGSYYCIVSSDSGYEYREKLGELEEPPPIPERPRPPIPKPPPDDPGDPFAPPSEVLRPTASAPPEANAAYERLLYWISARGEGTWAQFRDAAQTLAVVQDREGARSAMRRLILLGHVDQSDDGARWSASPSALVRFADGAGGGYVAGARTPKFLSELAAKRGALNESPQTYYAGPPRISLSDVAGGVGIADAGIASERLADILPGVDEWKAGLKAVDGIVPASYEIERWEGGEFRPCYTLSLRDGRYRGESGMYRFSRESDPSGWTRAFFFDEPSQRFLRGDWYGLRFLSLAAGATVPQAVWDEEGGALLIPESQRWPLIYERALTLASGLLPSRADNPDWLYYPLVPLSLAETLRGKLNVNLTEGRPDA